MGKFAERQEWLKKAEETRRLSRDKLGSFFYDLAKIAFTALVVGSIVSVVTEQKKFEHWILIAIGSLVTYIFSIIGYKIIKS